MGKLSTITTVSKLTQCNNKKVQKSLIPEEYQNCSLKDVNEFILRLQMTYPTHVHCKIIETEVIFINDWMLNYLKTILRRRYAEKKEKLIYKSRTTTSSNNPFENFLLSLSGITQNNVSQISASLGEVTRIWKET